MLSICGHEMDLWINRHRFINIMFKKCLLMFACNRVKANKLLSVFRAPNVNIIADSIYNSFSYFSKKIEFEIS